MGVVREGESGVHVSATGARIVGVTRASHVSRGGAETDTEYIHVLGHASFFVTKLQRSLVPESGDKALKHRVASLSTTCDHHSKLLLCTRLGSKATEKPGIVIAFIQSAQYCTCRHCLAANSTTGPSFALKNQSRTWYSPSFLLPCFKSCRTLRSLLSVCTIRMSYLYTNRASAIESSM